MKWNVTISPKIALCRVCHGTGLAPTNRPDFGPTVCPQCGGIGRVTVSANIELDIRPYNPKIQEE